MLTGPRVMDIDTEVSEWLDDFNIVPSHRHEWAWGGRCLFGEE